MEAWCDERREAQARAYDRSQALLFLLRFALLFALAAVFWLSGFSRALAEGLREWFSFPYSWSLVAVAFLALSVFGYEAILFPLSVLADYSLEKARGRLAAEFGEWLRGYAATLLLEVAIVTAGFTGIYLLMRLFPAGWWLGAAAAYAALVAGLGEWGPSRLLPRVRPPVPGGDALLEEELRQAGREAGLEIERRQFLPAPLTIGVIFSPKPNPKSDPPPDSRFWMCASGVKLRISRSVSAGVSGSASSGASEPWMRMTGGRPTARWRSEAPSFTASSSRSFIWTSEDFSVLISHCLPWSPATLLPAS